MDEVDKCAMEDNRNEGETVEAEAEPEAQVNENHQMPLEIPCSFGEPVFMGEPAILGLELEREIKDTVSITGDMIGRKIMSGIIRAAMWTNGAMLLVTAIPVALTLRAAMRAQVAKKAIVSGWEAMIEKLRALIPPILLKLAQKAEDANRDEQALYELMEDISLGVEATGDDGAKRVWLAESSLHELQWHRTDDEEEGSEGDDRGRGRRLKDDGE